MAKACIRDRTYRRRDYLRPNASQPRTQFANNLRRLHPQLFYRADYRHSGRAAQVSRDLEQRRLKLAPGEQAAHSGKDPKTKGRVDGTATTSHARISQLIAPMYSPLIVPRFLQ